VFEGDSTESTLDRAVVRICPACGVVNPGGPSVECPHLQLVRFDGVDPELGGLLAEVADARRQFVDLKALLKSTVLRALKDGRAAVETTSKAPASELETTPRSDADAALSLTHPEKPARSASRSRAHARARRKRGGQPAVDPRQLELLAQSPPKGDA
jgi:hypothetical protein